MSTKAVVTAVDVAPPKETPKETPRDIESGDLSGTAATPFVMSSSSSSSNGAGSLRDSQAMREISVKRNGTCW